MKIFGKIFATVAFVAAGAVSVSANDSAELADLQARIATLEARLMAPAGGGDAEALTSLRKKGAVKIGGSIELDVIAARRDEANNSNDSIDSTRVGGLGGNMTYGDTDLDIRVDTGPDTYLFLKLDLDDTENANGDLTEEVQFVWNNVRGSNWSLIFGKDELPFGTDKDVLIVDPYVHGNANGSGNSSSVMLGQETRNAGYNTFPTNYARTNSEEDTHESPLIMGSVFGWPGEIDNRHTLTGIYKYKELGTVELSIFQDIGGTTMAEDRSADHGLQNFAIRLKAKPVKGLNLSASFINRHDDRYSTQDGGIQTMGGAVGTAGVPAAGVGAQTLNTITGFGLGTLANRRLTQIVNNKIITGQMSPNTWNDFAATGPSYEDDQMSVSVSFDYTTADEKWNFFGEWIHGWHVGNLTELAANVIQLGAIYGLTPKIDLITTYDYLGMDSDVFNTLGINFSEKMHRARLGAAYKCDNGITFKVEYGKEWYTNDLTGWDSAEANVFAFRTAYYF